MNQENNPIRHHYTPVFYLKKWCNENKKLYRYKHEYGKIVCDLISPKSTGDEKLLYSLIKNDGVYSQEIEETHYKPLDDFAAKVLNKIISNSIQSLNSKDRDSWSDFLTSMLFRHESHVKTAKKIATPIFEAQIKNVDGNDTAELLMNHPVIQQSIENSGVYATACPSGNKSDCTPELDVNQKYRECFTNLNWFTIDYTNSGIDLLTSDYPIMFHGINKKKIDLSDFPDVTAPLNLGHVYLSMPLSPSLCFYAEKINPMQTTSREELRSRAKDQNRIIVQSVKNFIYANNKNSGKFIEKMFAEFKKRKNPISTEA